MSDIRVMADVAGTVWKVLVSAGDGVASDDTLFIIESMKMEIPVAAPSVGRVVSVLVAEGAAVDEGQLLAILRGL